MIALLLALALAQESPPPQPTVQAVVAARDLYPGVVLEADDLYAVEAPQAFLPPGAVVDVDAVLGKAPWTRVLANEFLVEGRFEPASPTLPVSVPEGARVLQLKEPGPTKLLKRVELWRLGDADCRLADNVKVVDRDPFAVAVPANVLAAVLDADAEGTLRAISPASRRGGPCP